MFSIAGTLRRVARGRGSSKEIIWVSGELLFVCVCWEWQGQE
jgi:hypothetical protein